MVKHVRRISGRWLATLYSATTVDTPTPALLLLLFSYIYSSYFILQLSVQCITHHHDHMGHRPSISSFSQNNLDSAGLSTTRACYTPHGERVGR